MPFARFRPIKQFGRYANRFLKKEYEAKREETLPRFVVPPELLEKGVEIVEPNRADFPVDRRPKPVATDHPLFRPPPREQDHPLYQPQPAHLYDGSELMSEGLDQVLALTKGVRRDWALDLASVPSPDDEEALVRELIMAACAWDSELVPLPAKRDERLFWLRFPRQLGISLQRQHGRLLAELVHYARSRLGLPSLAPIRPVSGCSLSALVEVGGAKVCFRASPLEAVFSDAPAGLIASAAEVGKTAAEARVDVYPIKPLIDFPETRLYSTGVECGGPRRAPELQTLLDWRMDAHEPRWAWSAAENSANAALKALTAALVQARRRFGPDLRGQLPEPVVGQAAQLNNGVFDFAAFQLNTLDWDSDAGVKNVLMMKTEQRLFRPKPHWEDFGGEVEGLDLAPVHTLVSLLANRGQPLRPEALETSAVE